MLLNSFWGTAGGGGGGGGSIGVLAYRTVDQSVSAGVATVMQFDAESYDYTTAMHENVTNNSRFTVPSGVSRVKFSAGIFSTEINLLEMLKNGATFRGGCRSETETAGNDGTSANSAVLAVTAGDYFEARGTVETTTFVADPRTWGALEVIDPTLRCALVYHSTTQSLSAGVNTILTWDSEEYDDAAYHDTSTNPSRLTIPSGVTRVKVSAGIKGGNVTGQLLLEILKNGASARGAPRKDSDTPLEENLCVVSAVLEVTTGDYFEVQAFATSATSITADNEVWFAIEEIPSTFKRALVNKTAAQSITADTATVLTWDAEVYDADDLHDNVTNNSRITAPSGVSYARCSANLLSSSVGANYVLQFLQNGAVFTGTGHYENDTAGTDALNACGAWAPCSPGDYFEARIFASLGVTFSSDNVTWFCVEFR